MTREKQRPDPRQLRVVSQGQPGAWGDHPSLEHLAAYHEGEIQGEERERIQAHLVECRDCTRLLLDFASFDEGAPPSGVRELPDAEVEEAWERMQERATPAAVPAAPPAVAQIPSRRAEAQPHRSYVPHMLAAAGLAATVGLSLWGAWLHQELLQARKPELNVETHSLEAQPVQSERRVERGAHRGGERGSQHVEELSGDRSHTFEFHLDPHKPFSRFRFEILRADGGEPLFSDDALDVKLDLEGGSSATFRLPAKSLPPGTYTFRISGLDGATAEPVASYSVRITP